MVAGDKPAKEFPYCICFLVLGALVCHTAVFTGNLATASAMMDLGKSTRGWSDAGLELSHSLGTELDELLSKTSLTLTKVLTQISVVQKGLDLFLGAVGIGTDEGTLELIAETSLGNRRNTVALYSSERVANSTAIIDATVDRLEQLKDTVISTALRKAAEVQGVFDKVPAAADAVYTAAKSNVLPLAEQYSNGSLPQPQEIKAAMKETLRRGISMAAVQLMDLLSVKLDEFLITLKPALIQIGKWLVTFGDKIQATIETFSTTLDMVQKIFDQLMAKATPTGAGADQMLYDTFTLFDVSQTGTISVQDLHDVSELYGIPNLAGEKADALHKTYDLDADGELSKEEYAQMVTDPSIPGSMAVVLRTFAKKLSVISGNVAAARMRSEVADKVVEYFTLICAKNRTKVQWVSDRLTNASLPLEFTAVVLGTLALDVDNPEKMTKADVGQIVLNEMYRMSPEYVGRSLELMSDPQFWLSEGLDPTDQELAVERVTRWVANAENKQNGSILLSILSQPHQSKANGSVEATMTKLATNLKKRQAALNAKRRAEHAAMLRSFYSSETARTLRSKLLGGVAASAVTDDTLQAQAINSGQPAVPETLEFAKFLSWNASQTADRFQDQSFNYSGTSSSALDSFSTVVKGMVKKVQTFLNQMEEYATPKGTDRLESMVDGFKQKAADIVTQAAMEKVDPVLDKAFSELPEQWPAPINTEGNRILFAKKGSPNLALVAPSAGEVAETAEATDTFVQVSTLLTNLQSILPDVIDNLKNARQQVSAASEGLKSVFSGLHVKGPPIFDDVSAVYSALWTFYFATFVLLTMLILGYGFWATGWCGGSKLAAEDYEEPRTWVDRLSCVYASCTSCLKGCHDSPTCFWSFILLFEVVVLALFIVSVVLCLVSGIKAFLTAGCSQVYIIGDASICGGTLNVLKQFLETFWENANGKFEVQCEQKTLMTCAVIGRKLQNSTISVAIGSILASVLTFLIIIESAAMHERARWRHMLEGQNKSA